MIASLSRFPPEVKCVNNLGFFKKCEILDDKHFLCLGTITLIPFLGWRIAKKDCFYGSRIKFGSVLRVNVEKCNASECFEWKGICKHIEMWEFVCKHA